jgi:hypothetical protein
MGLAIRTTRWRYICWYLWDGKKGAPRWHEPAVAVELYDHQHDDGLSFDDDSEAVNLSLDGEYSAIVQELDATLRTAFNAPGSH